MKKIIAALATSVLMLTNAVAQTLPPPTIAARSWLLLDATSGQIIASQDPNARIEPASLTKIMTAYVTFGALRDKKIDLKQMVNVSTKAWWKGLELAGIENFRWHDLRHTFATWHRQAGTPTHELQRLGGWKTLSMVERYAHVAPEGLQAAASRLDNVLHGYALATPDEKRD